MLTFSTGHGGGLLGEARLLFRHYRHNRRFAELDWAGFRCSREAFARHGGRPLEGARVLDLGCGQRFPATLLFRAFGARVTGIDTDVVDPGFGPAAWWRMARRNGLGRCAKSLVRHAVFDRAYYRDLARLAGRPLRVAGLDVRLMDARALAFPDARFDLVHSNAVFEHLSDVPRVLEETARVLRPEGVASILVHLFPSLSGGHHPEWAFPDLAPSRRVPPWDHLRAGGTPGGAFLNRWRARQFLEAFDVRFRVVERETRTEGERWLTPERERELAGYTREDLLTRTLRVVLRPRPR